jgi:hypothetical protein
MFYIHIIHVHIHIHMQKHAALSYPRYNRHVMFRGNLAHGVVGTLSQNADTRVTFLVNYWQYKPIGRRQSGLNMNMNMNMNRNVNMANVIVVVASISVPIDNTHYPTRVQSVRTLRA